MIQYLIDRIFCNSRSVADTLRCLHSWFDLFCNLIEVVVIFFTKNPWSGTAAAAVVGHQGRNVFANSTEVAVLDAPVDQIPEAPSEAPIDA